MKALNTLLSAALLAWAGAGIAAQPVTLYKSPSCGCCVKYADYLRRNGFDVKAVDSADTDAVKDRLGVPDELRSCHTMVVGDYVVEGHVPAQAIARLLKERPAVRGLAVPGMPPGSPGMEGPPSQPFASFVFDARGRRTPWSSHQPPYRW